MKVMTKAVLTLSLSASALLAAPKPLLNPFADTMNTSANTVTTALPTGGTSTSQQQQQQVVSSMPMDNASSRGQQVVALPTVENMQQQNMPIMTQTSTTRLVVKGQGVAPSFTQSPAQAFALAKRAAMVDAYRLLGEKIQGVKVEGQDLIKNMMVKRSQVRTEVNAMIKEATVIETEFKDGLCEVEVELVVSGARWHATLSHSFAE